MTAITLYHIMNVGNIYPVFSNAKSLYHSMRHANSLPASEVNRVDGIDMKFEIEEGAPCEGCRFDLRFAVPAGNVTLLKLIEYKSYLYPSKLDLPQFLNYMKSISDLRQLNYVFNSAKVSLEQAKTGVRAFFLKSGNAEAIWDVNAEVLKKLKKSNGQGFIETIEDFEELISKEPIEFNELYNFIKVYPQ